MRTLTHRSIKALTAGTSESNSENIRQALARGLTEFSPAICAHDGSIVIVGSGPSLTSFAAEIREERAKGRPIVAIKGAHDWLCDEGIDPDVFVSVEPRSRPLKRVSKRTVYLLASRCPPDLFDQVKDCRVVLWHSLASKDDAKEPDQGKEWQWDDFDPIEECEVWKGRFGVGGGSTSGLRAMTLAFLMGFRHFILYGFDSCLAKDRDTKRFSGEKVGDAMVIDVIVDGHRFWCNGALADQAIQFQRLIPYMPGVTFDIKGYGLLKAIVDARLRRAA